MPNWRDNSQLWNFLVFVVYFWIILGKFKFIVSITDCGTMQSWLLFTIRFTKVPALFPNKFPCLWIILLSFLSYLSLPLSELLCYVYHHSLKLIGSCHCCLSMFTLKSWILSNLDCSMSMWSIVFLVPADRVNGGRFVWVIMWASVGMYQDWKIYFKI